MKNKKKILRHVLENVNKEISNNAARGGRYAGALSAEGYHGGYAHAIDDVMLLLNDVMPDRNHWWPKSETSALENTTEGVEHE